MLIQLKDQVRFFPGFHETLEIFHDKAVRRAFERGEQHRIGPRGPGRGLGSGQDPGPVVPVDLVQQVLEQILVGFRQHVLEKDRHLFCGENIGNGLVHGRRQHRVRPAQKHHVEPVAGLGVFPVDLPDLPIEFYFE